MQTHLQTACFAFTTASTPSVVGLLPLLFDFFNELSID